MTESALELRARKLRQLEENLAREKRMKRLEDHKYKRQLELLERKHKRPETAKNKRTQSLHEDKLAKRN